MVDLFLFYWFQQVKTAAIAAFFAFCGACLIYSLGSTLYDFAIGILAIVFGFAWPRVLASPMLNFHWMATLPISRVSLMFTRICITIAGGCTLMFFYLITQTTFSLLMPRPQLSRKAAEAAAKLMAGITVEEPGFSLTTTFGEKFAYIGTLSVILLGLSLLALSSSSVMIGQPSKSPKVSGNPWWHPELKMRAMNWGVLLGSPLLMAALTPYAKSGGPFATVNFLIAVAWLVYVLGLFASLNARIPRNGAKRWLMWLGAGHALLAGLAVWAA